MSSAIGVVLAISGVLSGMPMASAAAEVEGPAFKLVKAEAQIHDVVPEPYKVDIRKPAIFGARLAPPQGKVLLTITAYIVPEFKDSTFMLQGSQVELRDGNEAIRAVGSWGFYAALYQSDDGDAVLYEPKEWKTKPHPLTCNWVYLAPAGKKSFTLNILGQTAAVTVPAQKKPIDMNDVVAFKIVSAKLTDSLAVDKRDPLTNPAGKLLLLKCEWTEKARNDMTAGNAEFQFPAEWVNVVYGKNQVAPNLASVGEDGKTEGFSSDGGSNTLLTGGSVDVGYAHEDTFVFPVAADTRTFQVTCFGFPMTKGLVGR